MQNLEIEVIENREEVKNLTTNSKESLAFAEGFKIKTQEDHDKAAESITRIRNERNRGDEMRRFFTDPLNEQVKKINGLFQPTIKALEDAERKIRMKMGEWVDMQRKKADEARAKTMEKIESGEISVEKGVKKMENVKMPEKTRRTEAATVSYRIDYDVTVDDLAKLPAEYLVPDLPRIKTMAVALHKAKQQQIPGVKVTERQTPIVRRNQ